MIFISVGTQLPFPRLLEYCERAKSELNVINSLFAQTLSDQPQTFDTLASLPREEFTKKLSSCQFFISHAGMGNILAAREFSRPVILVPRESQYGEHRNDHQMDTARSLEGRQGFFFAKDYEQFKCHFEKLLNKNSISVETNKNDLALFLKQYLQGEIPFEV